jgi:lipoate-protein ligase A
MSPSRHARLIIDGPASGAWNMAVDEVLLQAAQRGEITLRFYQWSPATLSLGYFQAIEDRQQHAASQSCRVVRRTTGGGAILHDRELTYSICLPCRERFSASAESIYDAFHDTLVEVFANRNVLAHRCHQSDATCESKFLCFERRAKGDVLIDTSKVAGSAQRRHSGALLQHGSILLAASDFAPELPGINDLTRASMDCPDIVNEWILILEERLAVAFTLAKLSTLELATAKEVADTRYSANEWVHRR